eukprot:5316139-Prymnesium_polylepis.1
MPRASALAFESTAACEQRVELWVNTQGEHLSGLRCSPHFTPSSTCRVRERSNTSPAREHSPSGHRQQTMVAVVKSAAARAKARGPRKPVQRLGMDTAVVAAQRQTAKRGRVVAGATKARVASSSTTMMSGAGWQRSKAAGACMHALLACGPADFEEAPGREEFDKGEEGANEHEQRFNEYVDREFDDAGAEVRSLDQRGCKVGLFGDWLEMSGHGNYIQWVQPGRGDVAVEARGGALRERCARTQFEPLIRWSARYAVHGARGGSRARVAREEDRAIGSRSCVRSRSGMGCVHGVRSAREAGAGVCPNRTRNGAGAREWRSRESDAIDAMRGLLGTGVPRVPRAVAIIEWALRAARGDKSIPKGGRPEYRDGPWYKPVRGKQQVGQTHFSRNFLRNVPYLRKT